MSQARISVYKVKRLMVRNTVVFCISVLCFAGVVMAVMLHAAPNMFLSKQFNNNAISLGENLHKVINELEDKLNGREHVLLLQSKKQLVNDAVNKLKNKT